VSTLFPLYLAQEDAAPIPPGSPGTPGTPGLPGTPAGTGTPVGPVTPGPSGAPIGPASSTVPSNPANLQQLPKQDQSAWSQIVFFAVIIGVMWFVLIGGQRKEKKKREAIISAVKKGDRVQTIGGIVGVVTDVRENEVVVKVDNNTNTRITFAKSAVQTVLGTEEKPQ
jgi:preprotein translocase subunit YajC